MTRGGKNGACLPSLSPNSSSSRWRRSLTEDLEPNIFGNPDMYFVECTRCTRWLCGTVWEYVEATGMFLPGTFHRCTRWLCGTVWEYVETTGMFLPGTLHLCPGGARYFTLSYTPCSLSTCTLSILSCHHECLPVNRSTPRQSEYETVLYYIGGRS